MNWLVYVSVGVGVSLLVYSLFLLARRRPLDSPSKSSAVQKKKDPANAQTEISLPVLGTIKTDTPAIIVFLIGAALLGWPLYKVSDGPAAKEVVLDGQLQSKTYPVTVFAVVRVESVHTGRKFTLRVPAIDVGDGRYTEYKVVYVAGGAVLLEEAIDLKMANKEGVLALRNQEFQQLPERLAPVK